MKLSQIIAEAKKLPDGEDPVAHWEVAESELNSLAGGFIAIAGDLQRAARNARNLADSLYDE